TRTHVPHASNTAHVFRSPYLPLSAPSPALFSTMTRPPPTSTLFPYTTLFRSSPSRRDTGRPPRLRIGSVDSNPGRSPRAPRRPRSEEHTSELQSRGHLVCRLLLEKKKRRAAPDRV